MIFANKITEVEQFLNDGWPALELLHYDGWSLRFADGLTKRANSVSVSEHNHLSVNEKIDYCESLYHLKNLPAVFKVTSNNNYIDEVLAIRGYEKAAESFVMELDLQNLENISLAGVRIEYGFSDRWLDNFINAISNSEGSRSIYRKIFAGVKGDNIICANVEAEDKTIAFGYGYVKNEMLGIFDIYVNSDKRGRGYGRRIVNAILLSSGGVAKKSYLQVLKANKPAVRLYKSLGFQEIYRYWYRTEERNPYHIKKMSHKKMP